MTVTAIPAISGSTSSAASPWSGLVPEWMPDSHGPAEREDPSRRDAAEESSSGQSAPFAEYAINAQG